MSKKEVNKRAVRRLANRIGVDSCYQLFEIQRADILAQSEYQKEEKLEILTMTHSLLDEIVASGDCLTLKDLRVNGKDLIALGVSQGKEIGRILNTLLAMVLEQPELNQRDVLLKKAKEEIK